MANRFTGLTVDEEDRSTDNLPRKIEKMKRMQERNPTAEREGKIQELESIVNPPKPIPVQSKKKNNKKKSQKRLEKEEEKQRLYHERMVEKEKKRLKKEEEERKREREYEEYKREQEEKEREHSERREKREENRKKRKRVEEIKEEFKDLPEDIIEFLCYPPDKKKYKKLSLIYHPDKGGNAEYFKIINNHNNP